MSEVEESVYPLTYVNLNKKATEDEINDLSMILKNLPVHVALIISRTWKHGSMCSTGGTQNARAWKIYLMLLNYHLWQNMCLNLHNLIKQ